MASLTFSRNFPNLEIYKPYYGKSHVSDISYKAYMGKTIICHRLALSTIIIVLYSCMVTTCTCICTGVSINSRFSKAYTYVHKKSSLVWPDSFLAQGVYRLQYQHPAKALSVVVMLCSYLYVLDYLTGLAHNFMQHILRSASYYFHLKVWTEQLIAITTCCSYGPIDFREFELKNHS